MSKPLVCISYVGGKSVHLKFIKPLLPEGHYHFVDAMCGGASVSLNVDYPLVTINDINEDVINLFTVLRNQYGAFKRAIKYTPFARQEIIRCAAPGSNAVEKARRFYVRALQGFGASQSQNTHLGWGGQMAVVHGSGRLDKHFRVDTWNSKMQQLDTIVSKLRQMQIESMPVFELLKKYDRPQTIIYIDPPYELDTRNARKRYRHEFDNADHAALAEAANDCSCMVAISGYESDLYKELYPADKWHMHQAPALRNTTSKTAKQETLWTNYSI